DRGPRAPPTRCADLGVAQRIVPCGRRGNARPRGPNPCRLLARGVSMEHGPIGSSTSHGRHATIRSPGRHRGSQRDIVMSFVVATGIEWSAPLIAGGLRRDELLLTGHHDRVEEDLDLVVGLGITHLRYGVPFHVVAADPDALDWAWTDRAMAAIRERPIAPIARLLHFGVPDDLWGIGDPRLIQRYRTFVHAFVERYPWVRWYTPVNEPCITAQHSAKLGWWNERRASGPAFVRALLNVSACAVIG